MHEDEKGVRLEVDPAPELGLGGPAKGSIPGLHKGPRRFQPAILMHDRDTKFSRTFVRTFDRKGVRTNPLPVASPNLTGRSERFTQTIKLECLARFKIFGNRHVNRVSGFLKRYNIAQAHMERQHLPPLGEAPNQIVKPVRDQIEGRSSVGGLVKSFERKAA